MSRTLPLDTLSTPGRLVDVSTVLTSAHLLGSRFRLGYQMTLMPAISKVNGQADHQPHDEADPCGYVEECHHSEADNYAENRNHGNERRFVRTRSFGMGAPHDNDADTNDDECQKRADARHIAKIRNGQKSRKQTDEYHQQQIRTPWRSEGRMDIAKKLRKQPVTRHR